MAVIKMDVLEILRNESQKCIRCGFCVYVCPSWNAHGKLEYYSPRARVTLIRSMLEENFNINDAIDSLFTCNTCMRCLAECPTGINVADLIIYARHYSLQKINKE
ncbi:MAG: 4Fe-4S dicluster domain-containing protein [Euryarchaeota archaeon]|jgi:glycolate oxidase iron-sulfur subunit|nr:4Fe-4S dicluster domain-containing protein [Euryarchaeota archaeon]MVT36077.1 4Fe-4S dicluster domain-containing protein [Euryarchaeota archaeon]